MRTAWQAEQHKLPKSEREFRGIQFNNDYRSEIVEVTTHIMKDGNTDAAFPTGTGGTNKA